ncbi:hypothetical protein LFUMFP_140011 [Latilactobacillus fuchuensis]|uniref:Uncharacterized protein n=2 Tax=Latilactobacillus fuchuensis TaxID=164393 RepID=A0A2N9DU33_9LACO|nr:hypothetical protein FC69_GL001480 [Latilactobacillus fuchuensis DSM 14340 = JCM 11249]SPC37514.1 hypothetical protein LFUMFP_140011 [Latilactobacillus fuchuensis]
MALAVLIINLTLKAFHLKRFTEYILPQISNLSNHFYIIVEIGLDCLDSSGHHILLLFSHEIRSKSN